MLRLSPRRTAVLITLFVLLGSSLFFVAWYNYERYRPVVYEPLTVSFEVTSNNSTYQRGIVGFDNNKVEIFYLPKNSQVRINYGIGCHAKTDQTNVTLTFRDTSKLSLLTTQNETLPIPYTFEVGNLKTNSYRQFSAVLQTPTQTGLYQIQCTIKSDQTTYGFTVIAIVR